MDRDEMSNLYRGHSIDDSYQISVHLAEGFQRKRLKCEKLTDDRRRTPSDGKSSRCLWQGELKNRRRCSLFIVCCQYSEVWQYKRRRIYLQVVFFLFYLQNEMLCTKYIIVFSLGNSFPIVSSGEVQWPRRWLRTSTSPDNTIGKDSLRRRQLQNNSASSLKQQSVGRHVIPLGHIILIPSQPVFTLAHNVACFSGEAANTNFIV